MKIAIIQTQAIPGDIHGNIARHVCWVRLAIQREVDLIVFPELSITGYEPSLAGALARSADDEIFTPFSDLAKDGNITIGIGMPTKTSAGIHISMMLFKAGGAPPIIYSKGILHPDEEPYFVASAAQPCLDIQGRRVAVGICYETLQRAHFLKAQAEGADVYVASVAKPERATDNAYLHFPSIAQEFSTPILMANAVGPCDDFVSNGRSSVWNREGKRIAMLDGEHEGLIVYDTDSEEAQAEQVNIDDSTGSN